MSGEGLIGSNGACSTLYRFAVTPSTTQNHIGPFWCCFPSGWVCVRSRTLWVSPVNSPVRLGVSPTAASTPTGVFSQCFEALFPHTGALGCVFCLAPPAIPHSLSMRKCGAAGSSSHHLVGSASCSLASPSLTVHHLACSASCHLTVNPLHPGCPSPPLLLVWMNISSLSPWLLDFLTV